MSKSKNPITPFKAVTDARTKVHKAHAGNYQPGIINTVNKPIVKNPK